MSSSQLSLELDSLLLELELELVDDVDSELADELEGVLSVLCSLDPPPESDLTLLEPVYPC